MNIHHRCHDVTVEPGRPSPMSTFRGTAKAALFYCTHRTAVIHSIDPSKLAYLLFTGGWPVWSPTARVQRGPSEAARCASTGDQQATLVPPLLTALSTGSYNLTYGLSYNRLIQLTKWRNLRTSTSRDGRGWSM